MVAAIDLMQQELKKREFTDTSSGYTSRLSLDISKYSDYKQVGSFDVVIRNYVNYDIARNVSEYLRGSSNHQVYAVISSPFTRLMRPKQERAIALLDAWINEAPNDEQKLSLDKLKIEIDSHRTKDRKLYT